MKRLNEQKVSKLMAYILRHSPEEFGLKPDDGGFVPLDELVRALKTVYPDVDGEFIREIVKNDPKGRYEIKDGKIRARYGHSYPVSLNHKEDTKSSSSPWDTEEKPIIHP